MLVFVCTVCINQVCVCVRARLRLLPRLAYHVEHQDKRIRRGVGVRAGGSQGRRELQAAADNELVTERCAIRRTWSCRILGKHVHAVHSSVLIWRQRSPLRFGIHFRVMTVRCRKCRVSSFPSARSQGRTGAPCRALPAHTLAQQQLLASQLQRHPACVLVRGCYDSLQLMLDLRSRTVLPAPQRAAPRPARGHSLL